MDESPLAQLIIKELTIWVRNNLKLKDAITVKNLQSLFLMEFPFELTIDLTRFEKDYYNQVFAYKAGQINIDAFVKKVCLIIRDTIKNHKKNELKFSFQIKNKIRKARRIIFIHPNYK